MSEENEEMVLGDPFVDPAFVKAKAEAEKPAPAPEPEPEPDPEPEPVEEYVGSKVRETLERNTAWCLLVREPNIAKYLRYTPLGVETERGAPSFVRAQLYNAATAVLNAFGVPYKAQYETPFYVREEE